MSSPILEGTPQCVLGLRERNEQAHEIICKYATAHAAMDVGIGLTSFIPIPGAATVALIGAILAQAPLIYGPMTRDLAKIYSASTDEWTKQLVIEAALKGAEYDISIELGMEFMKEIASDLIGEAVAGFAATAIPFLGGLVAAGLDATVAATLTWRVGTMVSAYYQHGEQWVGDRKATYKLATTAVGGYSPKVDSRADLNDLHLKSQPIADKQLAFVMNMIDMLRGAAVTKPNIVASLKSKQVPEWLIATAMERMFA